MRMKNNSMTASHQFFFWFILNIYDIHIIDWAGERERARVSICELHKNPSRKDFCRLLNGSSDFTALSRNFSGAQFEFIWKVKDFLCTVAMMWMRKHWDFTKCISNKLQCKKNAHMREREYLLHTMTSFFPHAVGWQSSSLFQTLFSLLFLVVLFI